MLLSENMLEPDVWLPLYDKILRLHMPPAVLVSRTGVILHVFGDVSSCVDMSGRSAEMVLYSRVPSKVASWLQPVLTDMFSSGLKERIFEADKVRELTGEEWDSYVGVTRFSTADKSAVALISFSQSSPQNGGCLAANSGGNTLDFGMKDFIKLSSVGVGELELKGVWMSVNPALCEMLGWSVDELISQQIQTLVHVEDMPKFTEGMQDLFRESKKDVRMNVRLRNRKDVYLWTHVTLMLKSDANQVPQSVVVEVCNIDKEKRFESLLERKTQDMQKIVHVTSHELKTPLATVSGYARELQIAISELLRDIPEESRAGSIDDLLKDEIPEDIDAICTGVSQMSRLVNSLLTVSRLGRASFEHARVDMNDLVQAVIDTCSEKIKKAEAVLECGDLPDCMGDGEQLIRIWVNLLENAIKYRHEDRQPRVQISGREKDGNVIYVIADNGIGIDDQHREKVFDPFYRGAQSLEGDGIGLTVVKTGVEKMGGTINLESIPGQGTRFVVTLESVGERGVK